MTHQFAIEFVVEVPNDGVAGDVRTRLHANHARLCEIITAMTGHEPFREPGVQGMFISSPERVHWDAKERYWVGEGDEGDE